MDDLTGFVEKLAADRALRAQFAAAPREVLRAQGFNPDLYTIPEKMELSELEARLSAFQAQAEGSAVPTGVESAPASPLVSVDAGEGLHQTLARTASTGSLAEAVRTESQAGLPLPEFDRKVGSETSKTLGETAEAAEVNSRGGVHNGIG